MLTLYAPKSNYGLIKKFMHENGIKATKRDLDFADAYEVDTLDNFFKLHKYMDGLK